MFLKRVILGIDPGSFISGWVILSDDGLRDHGCWVASRKLNFEDRRVQLREEANSFVSNVLSGYRDVVVAIEDPMSRSFSVVKKLATIKTMFEEVLWAHGWVSLRSVHPRSWQRVGGGLAKIHQLQYNGPKDLSMELVKIETGCLDFGQDEADAYLIARYVQEEGGE